MKRHTFIKLTSAFVAAPWLSPYHGWTQQGKLRNWAGNLEYSTDKIDYPKSIEAVQAIVKKYSKLKVLGTRHCFNNIADSKDRLISTNELNKVVALDTAARTVTVEGGIKYGTLCP